MTTPTDTFPWISPTGADLIPQHGRAIIGYDDDPSPQFVWAIMARLALAVPLSWHVSDLWHDAQALAHAVPIAGRTGDALTFVYGVSDSHTHLYWDVDLGRSLAALYDNHAYLLRLARDERSRWVLTWEHLST